MSQRDELAKEVGRVVYNSQNIVTDVTDLLLARERKMLDEIKMGLDSYANDYYVAPASKFYKIYDKIEELRKG